MVVALNLNPSKGLVRTVYYFIASHCIMVKAQRRALDHTGSLYTVFTHELHVLVNASHSDIRGTTVGSRIIMQDQ